MEWTPEADTALKKVPFFVRKRVRARVEEETRRTGREVVSLADVKDARARFLASMKSEIKGYQIETCFGPSGCPNRAVASDHLLEQLEKIVKAADLLAFLQKQVKGELKFHHEFRIALADCPNACSQPQIKDIGIIGACTPALADEACSQCEACVNVCREAAIALNRECDGPEIDFKRCLHCGQCIEVCPTGTLAEQRRGFRMQLGGKLGRHPQLASELPGIYNENQVLQIVKDCLDFYKRTSRGGERFAQILKASDIEALASRHRW